MPEPRKVTAARGTCCSNSQLARARERKKESTHRDTAMAKVRNVSLHWYVVSRHLAKTRKNLRSEATLQECSTHFLGGMYPQGPVTTLF